MDVPKRPRPGARVRAAVLGLALAFPLLAAGCSEGGDPLALLLTDETQASILLDGELPVLERLAQELELEAELEEALLLWSRSWEEEGTGRWALRQAAYDLAMPVLFGEPEGRQREVVETVARAGRAMEPLASASMPPEIRRELDRAVESSRAAEEAWRRGSPREALRGALESADRIRELSPPVVAERLVRRLEDGDDTWPVSADGDGGGLPIPAGPVDGEDRERAERLLAGARHALEEGDYVRAIRRAHYARQLFLQEASRR